MPDTTSPRQAALWFAAHGYPVLPLHSLTDDRACTCGDPECHSPGKHPFAELAPHGVKNAVADAAAVRSWFADNYWLNYGIATDQILVVDVDVKHNGLETWADMCSQTTRGLIHTWQVRTGSGGRHVLFKNTPNLRCGSLDKGIDLRGVGGYIVGPTCKHVSGQTYEWLQQCSPKHAPLDELPEWLLTVIRTRTYLGRVTSIQEWRRIAGTRLQDGERTTTLLRLAGHLISNPLNDPIEIRELLLGWNRGMCDPPLADKRILQIVEGLCEREKNKEKWL